MLQVGFMYLIEKICFTIRHVPWLKRADRFWNYVRPWYERIIAWFYRNGLPRNINGTDLILLLPKFHGFSEIYEPEEWRHMMARVQVGDIVADVGSFIGLYTIALAKRVGTNGKVVAFEPDPTNFQILKKQVDLNRVTSQVELIQAAVSSQDGNASFATGKGCQSHINSLLEKNTSTVQLVSLDTIFANRHLDILKIDVEGYEEKVIQGGIHLLQDTHRSPRFIYLEVHPYAWPAVGTTSESFLHLLWQCDYRVVNFDGTAVERIVAWSHFLAYKNYD
jgi:FkbM family methyltransferase